MPARASVELDCRILPGHHRAPTSSATVRARLGNDIPYELELAGGPGRGQRLVAGRPR